MSTIFIESGSGRRQPVCFCICHKDPFLSLPTIHIFRKNSIELFISRLHIKDRLIRHLKKTGYTWQRTHIFYKGHNFCNLLFAFLCTNLLLKRVYSKWKEFAPKWSKFFPYRVYLFSEGRQDNSNKVPFIERV